MKAYTMSAAALTGHGNQIKELFLDKMVKEGKLTKEQEDELNNYCIVIAEKGFLGSLWDKLWKKDEEGMVISVVKVI